LLLETINDYYYYLDEEEKKLKVFNNLSKINLFVGSNNSGKSRMLREIFKIKTKYIKTNINLLEFNVLIASLKVSVREIIFRYNIKDYDGILEECDKLIEIEFIQEGTNFSQPVLFCIEKLMKMQGQGAYTTASYSSSFYNFEGLNHELNNCGEKYKLKLERLIKDEPKKYNFKKVYIPTLRGLRPFAPEDDIYHFRTKKDYFLDRDDLDIFTGLSLYQDLKKLLLGKLADREVVSKFQKFLGDTFFGGDEVTLIPYIDADVVFVKIGNENEKPIYNLGDGIQSIIILTFPLFLNEKENLLVFIEEPELYLHPGLQRKLIETYMKFENFQFYITTHSNHFLDMTLDEPHVSIYTFKKEFDESIVSREKEAKFIVDNVSNEDSNVLELLGVKNSSMFLANCTIWVEGITDRFYLRKYLQLYQESLGIEEKDKYREDYHYAFVEYSGNNITHWSFLDDDDDEVENIVKSMNAEKVCGKLFLIADKDSDVKRDRQDRLKEKLGQRFYCLECKEIENLLSVDVLKKVVSDYERKPAIFNRNISEADYKNKYIGKYIDDHLVDKKRRGSYGDKSGTINNKVNFCEKALNHMNSIEDMSEEAVELARKVYEFIKNNN
jgi:hypothetical protein